MLEKINEEHIDKLPDFTQQQIKAIEMLAILKKDKEILVQQRAIIPNKITVKEMPDAIRYDKLKPESKLFMNVIKMICYRAETAMAEIIAPHFLREKEEKRMLIKQLFNTPADIIPNDKENTLTIRVASLSAPRYNEAINNLCIILNQTETNFPGTQLKLIFKNHVD